MSEPTTFDRLMAAVQEAAFDPGALAGGLRPSWTRQSARPATRWWSATAQDTEDVRIFMAGFYKRGERRRNLERLYFSRFHALDERLPRLRLMPDSRLVHCRDLYTEEELKRSPCYNELLLLGQAQDSLIVRLDGPAGSRILWSIHNPVDGDGWTSHEDRLVPAFVAASASVRARAPGAGPAPTRWAPRWPRCWSAQARALWSLTGGGGLWRRTTGPARSCGAATGCTTRRARCSARLRRDNAVLQKMLARTLPPFGRRGESGSMTVGRSKGSPPLVLHVTPIGQRDTDLRPWPVAALLLVHDPEDSSRLHPATVAARLGLTRMESRVAVLLAGGKSVVEIAEATGRKETTIRWHLKQICEKHGIARQAEVVQLVLSLASTPDYR